MKKTYIKEIFSSIQGEGLFVGEAQTFVRFCRCNLACKYCDTDFSQLGAKEYSTLSFLEEIIKYLPETISFTGGEPLVEVDFLLEVLPQLKKIKKKIYLETNGTLFNELEQVIKFVDTVAMDIKVQSATGQKNRFKTNKKFLDIALKHNKNVFIKVVFGEDILISEIEEITNIAKEAGVPIILQPKMPLEKGYDKTFDKFFSLYQNVRLIPQIHKFLDLR